MNENSSASDDRHMLFEVMADNISTLIWVSNHKKECVYFNTAWLNFRGRTLAEEYGTGWAEGVHPDDYERCLAVFVTSFDRREPFSMTYRLKHADGDYRWIRDDGKPYFDKMGNFKGYIGSCYDITSEKETEVALKNRERDYHDLLKNIHAGVVVHGANGEILFANEQAAKILGISMEMLLGAPTHHPQWKFFHEDGSIMPVSEYPVMLVLTNKKELRDYIVGIYRPLKNDYAWGLVNGYPEFDDKGVLVHAVMTFVDISALKATQLKLQESQQRIELAQRSAGLGIWDWDIIRNTFSWDEQMMRLYGREESHQEISFELWENCLHPDDRERSIMELQDALAGKKEFKTSFRIQLPDGMERHIDSYGLVVRDTEGKPKRMLGVNVDSTERHQLEEQLRHMEKMDAIGHLAGGVAHDFNNQLTVILATAEVLKGRIEDESLRSYIRNISNAARRSSALTTNLLAFSRKGKFQNIRIDMHELLNELLAILQPSIDKRIDMRLDLRANETIVKGDPSLLQNALLNLAINARDAMPSGGTLSISTENTNFGSSHNVIAGMSMHHGPCLCIAVTDTGSGIPSHILPHIFEPFYTTKDPGVGTGMGLASVYGSIKQHQGAIVVDTKDGAGTSFKIFLPATNKTSEFKELTPPQASYILGKKLRILFVDDEEMLRDLACDILVDEGHHVTVCEDGAKAVDFYRHHWKEIDIVILDVMMPVMDGNEAFALMKQINPSIRVIFSSGYSVESNSSVLQSEKNVEFVQKPYTKRELMQAVERVAMRLEGQ